MTLEDTRTHEDLARMDREAENTAEHMGQQTGREDVMSDRDRADRYKTMLEDAQAELESLARLDAVAARVQAENEAAVLRVELAQLRQQNAEQAKEIERLRRWANGIEYHLGFGRISCEEVWSPDGEHIGIGLRQIEKQQIGSDTADSTTVTDTPRIVVCVHKIESAIVLLELVTKVCRFLTIPETKKSVKKAIAARRAFNPQQETPHV